jgi:peptide/nickel transport system ATP-binding protein/oligopeptide transport system ATP-binding protein
VSSEKTPRKRTAPAAKSAARKTARTTAASRAKAAPARKRAAAKRPAARTRSSSATKPISGGATLTESSSPPPPATFGDELLRVEHLVKYFPVMRGIIFKTKVGIVQAVDDVSLSIRQGETLGVVGESGCGKSTTARTVLRLLEPTAGAIWFDGQDIVKFDKEQLRVLRREMQIIFQDPFASLNPRMTVRSIVSEPLAIHGIYEQSGGGKYVADLLERVGLNPEHGNRYPHEFSGGQRQRIGVARALALKPKLIICDEPVSALDVSVQAQILNLLEDLQNEFGLTYMFIAHDLSVVRHISDRVAVMYLGKVVEQADRDTLYEKPMHPYTQALISAVPIPDPQKERARKRIILEGDLPSPLNPPPACRFHTRCWKAQQICRDVEPPLEDHGNGHLVACHFAEETKVL